MKEEDLVEIFSTMSDAGLEAFHAWLTFRYIEMIVVPFQVVLIFGFIGWGVFRIIKIIRDWD